MAQKEKKSQDLGILSEIYHDNNQFKKESPKKSDSVKKYFNDPKNVDKWLAGAVLFFAFFGVIFGFFHFKNQIKRPFNQPATNISLLPSVEGDQDLLGLRTKDTDQDGLSDYDELYIYGTSAYIEDSDSDGLDDQTEIARGSDPNCPAGQTCFTWDTEEFNELFPELEPQSAQSGNILLGNQPTASQLREMLSQAGITDLDSLSDAELIQVYQEALNESGQQVSPPPATVSLSADQIDNLTPQQVRELLQSSGIDAEVLSQVSDAELMNLVQETLVEVQ